MADSPLRIALLGATGRMGLSLVRLIVASDDLRLVSGIAGDPESPTHGDLGEAAGVGAIGIVPGRELAEADVLIDFSRRGAPAAWLPVCAEQGIAVVSGTTNLGEDDRAALDRAAEDVPVLWAPNLALGIHLLYDLASRLAAALGEDADIEIGEVHHRNKVDAPSGTALELGRRINRALEREDEAGWVLSRSGRTGPRTAGEIGFSAVRAGDVVGEHTALFALGDERIELTHRAASRAAFCRGALRAARWIAGRPAGRYRMDQVIGDDSRHFVDRGRGDQ